MKLKVSYDGVPPGNYAAQFAGIEQSTHDEFGPGLRWKFQISQGPHAGESTPRVTKPTPSPNNSCGLMLSGLVGRTVSLDEEIDLEQYIGQSYLIVVVETPRGGTRVDAVLPASDA